MFCGILGIHQLRLIVRIYDIFLATALVSVLHGVAGQNQYSPASGNFDGDYSDEGYEGGPNGEAGSLEETIPGVPGDDYPIFADVPETAFICEGLVEGGYYADPEAECQAFHICGSDGNGGLTKYSFLCPNGTIFQQQYFVCDWWFNVDCSLAESLYSLNDQVDAERQANSGSGGYQEASQAGGRRGSLSSGNEIGGYNPGEGRRRNSRDILREVLQDY